VFGACGLASTVSMEGTSGLSDTVNRLETNTRTQNWEQSRERGAHHHPRLSTTTAEQRQLHEGRQDTPRNGRQRKIRLLFISGSRQSSINPSVTPNRRLAFDKRVGELETHPLTVRACEPHCQPQKFPFVLRALEFTFFEKLSASRVIAATCKSRPSRRGHSLTHSGAGHGPRPVQSPLPPPPPLLPAGSWRVMPALSRANRGFSQVPSPWRVWFLAGISLRMRDPHPDPLFIHRPLATRFLHPRISPSLPLVQGATGLVAGIPHP
jgi:hypothetical protein